MKIWKVQSSEACGICPFNWRGNCLASSVLNGVDLPISQTKPPEKCLLYDGGILVKFDFTPPPPKSTR